MSKAMRLPAEVTHIITILKRAGYEAYAVGGCMRDMLLGKKPADWDVTTNAKPEQVQKLFPRHFYNNRFGTVTVLTPSRDPALTEVQVTTYRTEESYSDQRHPDTVTFTTTLQDDLARRDFTINAIALDPTSHKLRGAGEVTIIDPFDGQRDLNNRLIRAVGQPQERFKEDALRLLRAVRLAAQLDFAIEEHTRTAITALASSVRVVSKERVRDELIKLVMSDHPEKGFMLLHETTLLREILPELAEGVGVKQNKHHIYTVFEHSIKSLQFAADYDYPFHIRLAALLHDIGKPKTRRFDATAGDYTFYAHDIVGARMTEMLLRRLHFPVDLIKTVAHLVRHHMFYYDVGKITEGGIRRLLRRVGREHFDDLIKVRIAERKGSGVPKARPYRLRHLQFMVDKVSQQPISTHQLAIDGNDVMSALHLSPSPIVGGILNALLAEVIENPSHNTPEYLLQRARELQHHDPATLKHLGIAAVDTEEAKREEDIRKKYHV